MENNKGISIIILIILLFIVGYVFFNYTENEVMRTPASLRASVYQASSLQSPNTNILYPVADSNYATYYGRPKAFITYPIATSTGSSAYYYPSPSYYQPYMQQGNCYPQNY